MAVGLFARQVLVLCFDELHDLMLRRRSLLSLGFYFLSIAASLWLIFRVQAVLGGGFAHLDTSSPGYQELSRLVRQWGLEEAFAVFVSMSQVPDALWIFQIFSLLWFPTLVALISCDLVSIDIYRGTLRFLLLRTSRAGYFFGKMLSHFLLYVILQALSTALMFLIALRMDPAFTAAETARLGLQYFVVFVPFIWCMLAATQWISSWSRRPMSAMVRAHLMWVIFLVVAVKASWLTPFWSDMVLGMFSPYGAYPLKALLGYAAWGLGFTLLGYLGFARRDV
ncbi:MAG: hypothetical protein K1X79_05860 [Oligoflexia bacterium]|nr:hypothetical protein [Oligoflexia bacterium]